MSDSEYQYFLAALNMKFGYAIGISSWVTMLRLVMVFVNTKLQEFAESALPADKEWINKILNSRFYRFVGFVLNALASIKLPKRVSTGNTERITKP